MYPLGGCLNGSSAGKRRIADINIRTRVTASLYVGDSQKSIYLWEPNILAALSCGFVVALFLAVVIVVRVSFITAI